MVNEFDRLLKRNEEKDKANQSYHSRGVLGKGSTGTMPSGENGHPGYAYYIFIRRIDADRNTMQLERKKFSYLGK